MKINRKFSARPMQVAVIMTGGTIAKSYHVPDARLYNFEPKVKDILAGIRTDDLSFSFLDLMHKDSLEIGDPEREMIVAAVREQAKTNDAVLVTHGTDSMPQSAQAVYEAIKNIKIPVVFTGAMVPFTIAGSDAVQNITEALLALRLLPAGVFIAFHNRVLNLPGAQKDYDNNTFVGS